MDTFRAQARFMPGLPAAPGTLTETSWLESPGPGWIINNSWGPWVPNSYCIGPTTASGAPAPAGTGAGEPPVTNLSATAPATPAPISATAAAPMPTPACTGAGEPSTKRLSASGGEKQKHQLSYFAPTADARARLTLIIDKVLQAKTRDGQDKTVFHHGCKSVICADVAQDINYEEPWNSEAQTLLFADPVSGEKVLLTVDMVDYVWTKVVKTSLTVENPANDPKNTGENGSSAPVETKILARYWQVKQMKMRVVREAEVSLLACDCMYHSTFKNER